MTFRFGGTRLPLPEDQVNSLLRDADPAVFYLLQCFEWAIQTYIGPRWSVVAPAIREMKAPRPVMRTAAMDPAPILATDQVKFPLLAVYRQHTESSDHSIPLRQETTDLVVDYVLPPLTAGAAEQVHPFLKAVASLIDRFCQDASDFTPPDQEEFNSSEDPELREWMIGAKRAGIDNVTFQSADYGLYEGTKDSVDMYVVTMRLSLQEQCGLVTDDGSFAPFEGVDATLRDVASPLNAGTLPKEITVIDLKADVETE